MYLSNSKHMFYSFMYSEPFTTHTFFLNFFVFERINNWLYVSIVRLHYPNARYNSESFPTLCVTTDSNCLHFQSKWIHKSGDVAQKNYFQKHYRPVLDDHDDGDNRKDDKDYNDVQRGKHFVLSGLLQNSTSL